MAVEDTDLLATGPMIEEAEELLQVIPTATPEAIVAEAAAELLPENICVAKTATTERDLHLEVKEATVEAPEVQ